MTDKFRIVFSIPVHEKTEVVIEQIININHYNKDCAIVLHISKAFDFAHASIPEDRFIKIVNGFGNVFVNDTRLKTVYGNIVHTHIVNFRYMERQADFEFFMLLSSNEEFIRPGLYDEINGYTCGFNYQVIQDIPEWSSHRPSLEDPVVSAICARFGEELSSAVRSQVEGAFFKKELFHEVAQLIEQLYPFTEEPPACIYPREEVYYQEIAYFLVKDKTKILKAFITHNARDNVTWTPYSWVIRRIVSGTSTEYSVKRVGRELNHPTRSYIRNQCGHYSREVKQILPDAKNVSMFRVWCFDMKMVCKDLNSKFKQQVRRWT